MKLYNYQNTLISKKQLRQLLAWSFTNYNSMQACLLADELKYLGFKYASQSGISISIEDLRIPFVKSRMLEKANQDIHNSEKIFLKGKITNVERFQKIIDTWSLTSESLKNQIIYYFKNYDPLNSVYIMAFSGARGNLSQVRQLVGMRGLMSDPSGEIMNLPIKKNFREGLTITDYLMSGYGARKGIVDTALKTANSGYLTRRLIDVSQDIIIREKDCFSNRSFLISAKNFSNSSTIYDKILGRILNKPISEFSTISSINSQDLQITSELIQNYKKLNIQNFSVRSPLTCKLYRSICQKCYGWDLSTENLVDMGEAIGIIAGQSIGEPGTQLTMRTFHTGGIFTSEARQQIISPSNGIIKFYKRLKTVVIRTNRGEDVLLTKNSGSLVLIPELVNQNLIKMDIPRNTILFPKNNQYVSKDTVIGEIIKANKQVKTEVKTILSDKGGEIFIPRLKQKINGLVNNRLIWILEGQVYNSPLYSFLNFYPDYKLNSFSYIFRTKLINHYSGKVTFLNSKKSLFEGVMKINTHKYSLTNSELEKVNSSNQSKIYILTLDKSKYVITAQQKHFKTYLQLTREGKFGTLITNSFLTLTGGTSFYWNKFKKQNKIVFEPDQRQKILDQLQIMSYEDDRLALNSAIEKTEKRLQRIEEQLSILSHPNDYKLIEKYEDLSESEISALRTKYEKNKKECQNQLKKGRIVQNEFPKSINESSILPQLKQNQLKRVIRFRTIIWLGEEVHKIKGDQNVLLVEEGDFIPKGFELVPNYFSRTSGIVSIRQEKDSQEKNTFQIVSIKSGLVYKGKKQKRLEKKVYYPGEKLFSTITIKEVSLCDSIISKSSQQLLIRPLKLYEVPSIIPNPKILQSETNFQLCLTPVFVHGYVSNQQIYGRKNLNLVSNLLLFKTNNFLKRNTHIELVKNSLKKSVDFRIIEKLHLKNYIPPNLRDQDIQPCFLVQKNQFVSNYMILGL